MGSMRAHFWFNESSRSTSTQRVTITPDALRKTTDEQSLKAAPVRIGALKNRVAQNRTQTARPLLPLDRAGGLRADVINNAVHAANAVGDP